MKGYCRVSVLGRLGADPELRTSPSGQPWCRLSLATNRSEKQGDAWVEKTDWHRVKLFGDIAERCHRVLRKGSAISVEGDLQYERWTDGQGQQRFGVSIVGRRVDFVADFGQREEAAPAAAAEA